MKVKLVCKIIPFAFFSLSPMSIYIYFKILTPWKSLNDSQIKHRIAKSLFCFFIVCIFPHVQTAIRIPSSRGVRHHSWRYVWKSRCRMRHNQPTNSSASNQEKYRHKKTLLSKEKLQKHEARAARTELPFEQPLGESCLSAEYRGPGS